jgi:hypothetical protein
VGARAPPPGTIAATTVETSRVVLERLTDHAGGALPRMLAAAQAAGHEEITGVDVLLGLADETDSAAASALAELGISATRLREFAGAAPAGEVAEDGRKRRFDAEARKALERALREALALGRPEISTAHLLLGVRNVEGAGARLLDGLGATPDAVREAVLRQPAEQLPTFDVDIPPAPKPPGRIRVLLALVGGLLWYEAISAIMAVAAPPGTHVGTVLAYLTLAPLALAAVVTPLWLVSRGRRVPAALLRRGGARSVPANGELIEVLARRGISELHVWLHGAPLRPVRWYRMGRRAWIVLPSAVARNAATLRFALAQSTAHLLRNDSLRGETFRMLSIVLVVGAAIAGSWWSALAALVGIVGLEVGTRWVGVFACDAYAFRWLGDEAVSILNMVRSGRARMGLSIVRPPVSLRLWNLAQQPAAKS